MIPLPFERVRLQNAANVEKTKNSGLLKYFPPFASFFSVSMVEIVRMLKISPPNKPKAGDFF